MRNKNNTKQGYVMIVLAIIFMAVSTYVLFYQHQNTKKSGSDISQSMYGFRAKYRVGLK